MKADHSNREIDNFVSYEGDLITIDELEEVLRRIKNRKPTGQDGLNSELFKYQGYLV